MVKLQEGKNMKEIIENSILSDLIDALEIETDPIIIKAIQEEIERRTK